MDYRVKAQRILLEKENFITQLKSGTAGGNLPQEENILEVELEQVSRERDLCKEEASKFSSQLQATRKELQRVEENYQKELEETQTHEMQLSDFLREERIRREEAESESNQVKEEARFLREDLTRAKTSYMSKVEEKELELKQLRHLIMMKEKTPERNGDAELRIKQLTDNLIQKQSQLEALSSEKNTMTHKIEYLEVGTRLIINECSKIFSA